MTLPNLQDWFQNPEGPGGNRLVGRWKWEKDFKKLTEKSSERNRNPGRERPDDSIRRLYFSKGARKASGSRIREWLILTRKKSSSQIRSLNWSL